MNSTDIDAYFTGIIAEFLSNLLSLGFVIFVLGIGTMIGMVALITWVVKKVWNAGNNSNKTKKEHNPENEDWLTRAKRKEDTKFDYLNSHLNSDKGGYAGNPKEGIKWYPTGWTYNDKTGKWEPPDYIRKESKDKWRWDTKKGIWIDQEKEERLEKYRKYHEGRPATFEEWKAAREKENQDKA